ncbi:transcriptional regulator [Rhizobium sophorae]|uniref:Transcriptional regulator n=4 Tax=Rhizobium TaxID=379 RepID=A0A246DRF7_9HYPH|nr:MULTISPECIES: transcriptional repressor TraM [Rhizobium]MBB4388281.1 hypothetical protein [Rhizobium leguminosarum]MDR9774819.1 transcriptional repressor TraM [Rhizobium hidalgonense]NNU41123.1 transcriptional regulator [Rhizobium sophorae]OWO92906.1 transcriptional regulator [Rhizobium esperanzae]PCK77776.1 transcriptional regulator [Rhizobium sophoriradicis]
MKDASSSGADDKNGRQLRYSSARKSDLETLAVSAIREHRRLLAADQAVYDEWVLASDDPSISGSVLQALQNEHIARQKKSENQQEELSKILDALGYVPDVPLESDG